MGARGSYALRAPPGAVWGAMEPQGAPRARHTGSHGSPQAEWGWIGGSDGGPWVCMFAPGHACWAAIRPGGAGRTVGTGGGRFGQRDWARDRRYAARGCTRAQAPWLGGRRWEPSMFAPDHRPRAREEMETATSGDGCGRLRTRCGSGSEPRFFLALTTWIPGRSSLPANLSAAAAGQRTRARTDAGFEASRRAQARRANATACSRGILAQSGGTTSACTLPTSGANGRLATLCGVPLSTARVLMRGGNGDTP
ncbi:hypothetical protein C2E23DRAFT_603265 [Lenzites betulinus]|nr:hypothetical protein C2E23DRAFT_603265 [Lenzites betulinus]